MSFPTLSLVASPYRVARLQRACARCCQAACAPGTTRSWSSVRSFDLPMVRSRPFGRNDSPNHFKSEPGTAASLSSWFQPVSPRPLRGARAESSSRSSIFAGGLGSFASQAFASTAVPVRLYSLSRFAARRRLSTAASTTRDGTPPLPRLTPPIVGYWLLFSASLVFGIVIVGGLTRLTESGLSITEWKPVTGALLPSGEDGWEEEFRKYKETPEYLTMNSHLTLSEFKRIYMWEWAHRVWGRAIGIAFILPAAYFAVRGQLSKGTGVKLLAIAGGIGFQGFLGWYMVQSGLVPEHLSTNSDPTIPRVSHYRLAAHLGTAFLVYVAMLLTGVGVLRDYKAAVGKGKVSGMDVSIKGGPESLLRVLGSAQLGRYRNVAKGVAGLVFLTAMSGALVAGLDAGLLYNEFPLMGGRLVPPKDELFEDKFAKKEDRSDKWWRNMLENPTTVQFNHRVLAVTTVAVVLAFHLYTRRLMKRRLVLPSSSPSARPAHPISVASTVPLPSSLPVLPPLIPRLTALASLMALTQASLGITTLLYLVPIPLAAAHQAGSLLLLTSMLAVVAAARMPSKVVEEWRSAVRKRALNGVARKGEQA